MGSIKKIKMRNSIYDLEDARLEIGSVTTTPSFKGKPGVGFTTNSTPYAFLLRDFTSEVFGNNTQVIEWSHTHNMNDYKDAGTYRIKGERTGNPMEDNLPIMNSGSGHTIEGVLYVLDSSLTNGSGKESDCTVTQFLILSNRVGGQEGDMYMRSAYGANKDSLTWKPWEKYQTNVEINGLIDNAKTIDPNTFAKISDIGMFDLVDNGIYSGVYAAPKSLLGSEIYFPSDIKDPTAIETFVMVVINNYTAAGDARVVTQIKFAVTNGGVFSMEKRNSIIGVSTFDSYASWSQWESVGGGSGLPKSWVVGDNVIIGTGGVCPNVTIGPGVFISEYMNIKPSTEENFYTLGTDSTEKYNIKLGRQSYIGNNVTIYQGIRLVTGSAGDYVSISCEDMPFKTNTKFFGEDNQIGCTDTSYEGLSKGIGGVKIGCNVVIPDNLSFSIADNILTITDGTKTWKLTAEA